MKTAWIYAGQGAQKPGMGKDLYDANQTFADVVDCAEEIFREIARSDESYQGHDSLKAIMFGDEGDLINQTRYTQPAMAAFAAGVTAILKGAGMKPDAAAGLSLGEYNALYAAEVFDIETLIRLLSFRGKAMEEAAAGTDCAMSAVLGLSASGVQTAVIRAVQETEQVVEISNYNATGQIVIAGEETAVSVAEANAKELGAKRCMRLKVSGPFHTSFMKPAGDALSKKFREMKFGEMKLPVIFNATAEGISDSTAQQEIKDLLTRQVQSAVHMEQTILHLKEQGVEQIIEIGPGKTIAGFVKRTAKEIPVVSIDTAGDIDGILQKK